MLKRLIVFLLVFSFAAIAIAQTDTPRKPVIIDTDMAADDWMAILYLLQRSDVDVRAITVTGTGEAHCDPGVQNTMNLLALAGTPDIPVACGRETPLQGNHVFPAEWRENVDAMAGIELPTNTNAPGTISAIELLSEQINASSENITLLTLGPLTNIAEALQAEPALIDKIDRIYIMGGAVSVPGNLYTDNATAEWNIYVDPLAASIVFESGLPITLVALDVTNQAPITIDFYSRLARDRTTPEAEFVYQALTANLEGISGGWLYFWDPLAAVALTEPGIVSIQGRPLRVVTDEGVESGRTMPDGDGVPIDVAVGVDTAAFERIFLNVLNGRDPQAPLPAQVTVAEGGEANAAVVQRYFEEVWGTQNFAVLDELLDPNYLSHNNSDPFVGNRDSLMSTIAVLHTMMPDLQLTVQEMIVVGDTAAARITLRGTHTGDFLSLPPTNNPIVITINSILHLADGRIVEEWQAVDFFGLLIGTGAIPPDVLEALFAGEE